MSNKVLITNDQNVVKIPSGLRILIRRSCNAVLDFEKFDGPAEISVTFVDNNRIHELNNEYRHKDSATDVLSFPLGENGEYDIDEDNGCKLLGDIVISMERAMEQAELYGHSLQREVAYLTVHSMLHLLGYDHEAGGLEAVRMREKEEAVLIQLGLPRNSGTPAMRSDLARFARGFVYAWNGIRAAVKEERNFRFHLGAAFYAFVAAYWAGLSAVETALIALCVAAVMALELMNSAVERAVDKPDTTHWWTAGAAKDMAAGAVLVMAIGTVIVAVCLFGPRLGVLSAAFTARWTRPVGILLSLLIFSKFIFQSSNSTQKGEQPNGKTDS